MVYVEFKMVLYILLLFENCVIHMLYITKIYAELVQYFHAGFFVFVGEPVVDHLVAHLWVAWSLTTALHSNNNTQKPSFRKGSGGSEKHKYAFLPF